MKAINYLIVILAVFTIQDVNANQIHTTSNVEAITLSCDAVYPAIASTENTYGQNYSIAIEIHGMKNQWSKTINKVTCEGRSISYYSVYGEDDKYRIMVNGTTYYFIFR